MTLPYFSPLLASCCGCQHSEEIATDGMHCVVDLASEQSNCCKGESSDSREACCDDCALPEAPINEKDFAVLVVELSNFYVFNPCKSAVYLRQDFHNTHQHSLDFLREHIFIERCASHIASTVLTT